MVASRPFDTGIGDVPPSAMPAWLKNLGPTQFGGGASAFGEAGNLSVQPSSAGINPASTAADVVLAVFALPAGSLDQAGREIDIFVVGQIVNNANTKRVKVLWGCTTAVVGQAVSGGTVIADTGSVTTVGGALIIENNVYKTGALGSNTQIGTNQACSIGTNAEPITVPTALTAPENAPILIAVTGNAGTTATDITLNLLKVAGAN